MQVLLGSLAAFRSSGRIAGWGEQIVKQLLVDVAGEEAGQFAAQPVGQGARNVVAAVFEAMEDERAEQHLAARVPGAFLFAEPGFECRALCIQLGETFFDRFACYASISFSVRLPRLSFPAVFSSVCLLRLSFRLLCSTIRVSVYRTDTATSATPSDERAKRLS